MRVLLVGATGMVGRELLTQLLAEPKISAVLVLARRALDISHPKLICQDIDFEEISQPELTESTFAKLKNLGTVDAYISALGTTMKAAKNRAQFSRVDKDYVLAGAKVALRLGASHAVVISAIGASKYSPSFYSRCKFAMEQQLLLLDFAYITVLRPSLLLGTRAQHRPLEAWAGKWAQKLHFLWRGALKKYAPINSADLSQIIIQALLSPRQAVSIINASRYQ